MLLYTDSRKLVQLLLVAAYGLKPLEAIDDLNALSEVVRSDQVRPFLHDKPGGSATASTATSSPSKGTEAACESHNARNVIRKTVGSVWEKLNKLVSSTTPKLAADKKVHIHKQLEVNRDTIAAMNEEYGSLQNSIEELNKQMSEKVRRSCKRNGNLEVSDVLIDLKRFHKKHVLHLVQNRIYELGGIGSRMSEIEPASGFKALVFRWKSKLRNVWRSTLSFLGKVKQIRSDAEALGKLTTTEDMRRPLLGETSGEGSHRTEDEHKKLFAQKVKQDSGSWNWFTMQSKKHSSTPQSGVPRDEMTIVKAKQRMSELVDLRKILHSISFEISEDVRNCDQQLATRLPLIKISFEKCAGFKVLAFLYKFKLITENELNHFFDSKETLELTAMHLYDLFPDRNNPLSAPHALVPDLNFIVNNWRADHLRYLKDLDGEKKGHLVYTILKWASEYYKERMMKEPESFQQILATINLLERKNLLQEIIHWSPNPWNKSTGKPEENLMRQNIEGIIDIFKNYPTVEDIDVYDMQRAEFLINYYTLKFLKTYGNTKLQEFIQVYANDERDSKLFIEIYGDGKVKKKLDRSTRVNCFEKSFELISYGLENHQLTTQSHEISFFLSFPHLFETIIPKQITQMAKKELEVKIQKVKQDYSFRYNESLQLSKKHEYLRNWHGNKVVQDILKILKAVSKKGEVGTFWEANMWLWYSRFNLSFETFERPSALALFIKWNYDKFRIHHEYSEIVYEDFIQAYS